MSATQKKLRYLSLRVVLYLVITYLFASIWSRVLAKLDFDDIYPYSFPLLIFWVLYERFMFKKVFKVFENSLSNHILAYVVLSYIVGLPFFLLWDVILWSYMLKSGGVWENVTNVFAIVPLFFYLECFLYYSLFSTISFISLYGVSRKSGDWARSENEGSSDNSMSSLSLEPIITTTTAGEKYILKIEEIMRIEANRYYARLFLKNSDHLIRESLDSLEKKLENRGFKRIHRSHILNLSFMRKMVRKPSSKYVAILDNGQEIPISRTRLKDLREHLNKLENQ